MRLSTDRRYSFPFDPDEFWARVSRVDEYQAWWPWLRRFDGARLGAGDAWTCTVQPPVPYAVRFVVALDHVVAGTSVSARIGGDIEGRATLTVDDEGSGCCVRLVSELTPAKQSLRVMSLAARPIVTFGHNWVLDVGVRQFLARSGPPPD